ncbi:MAG: hypothetical protein JSS60_01270 [Verrucomicrobia bacterium]|nr:hypothetical protein [Verrucomicrobiota bacterium]
MKDLIKASKALIPMSLLSISCGFIGAPKKEMKPETDSNQKTVQEAYNPQYYSLKNQENGGFVTLDFLYWYARESNLDIGRVCDYIRQPVSPLDQPPGGPFANSPVVRDLALPTKHFYVDDEWSPGFRIGVGWNTNRDGWDLYANWTYYHNESKETAKPTPIRAGNPNDPASGIAQIRATGFTQLEDPWANALTNLPYSFELDPSVPVDTIGFGFLTCVTNLSGKWTLNLNEFDLELGMKYWVRKSFAIRPYFGLRGALTRTSFVVKGRKTEDRTLPIAPGITLLPGTYDVFKNRFQNEFWGVGLLGGLQPEFHITHNIILYGNLGGALLWGKYSTENKFDFDQDLPFLIGQTRLEQILDADQTERDDFSRMQGILDLDIGLRWEQHWCKDRYSTALDVGWEHHYWFDFGLYHRSIGINEQTVFADPQFSAGEIQTFNQTYTNLTTNLGFGGLVVRARFDF